jgi:hypothetical protein
MGCCQEREEKRTMPKAQEIDTQMKRKSNKSQQVKFGKVARKCKGKKNFKSCMKKNLKKKK